MEETTRMALMEFFVRTMFFVWLITFFIRIITLAFKEEWPWIYEKTLGMQVSETIGGLGFLVWTAILTFWK